ncbi:MAG: hypothetical protein A3J08_00395 [Candidatus Lloydbacteria bacterium RIFCSPLOWO2_02_FULL_51_11]|uniref:GWxTD domain-containing protein n=3 Tax=Candidatus Lloydiibacteriota TaxID=1817910 RepID=A0A1G2DRX0_9BACT|nr:MAG: hypothetical protein A3J08_00395 [Candidatus Lloydbacteria bacterium RIFCSPLOWO2_02_FULL_51_11]
MERRRQFAPFAIATVAMLFLASCVTPFGVACRDIAVSPTDEFKYADRQADIACERAQLYAFDRLTLYDKEKKQWEVNPYGIPIKDVVTILKNQAADIDNFLSFEQRKFADHIDWYRGLRTGLEKQEVVTQEVLRRLLFVSVLAEFETKVGPLPASVRETVTYKHFFPQGTESYAVQLLYSGRDRDRRLENIPFLATYLENAKADGTLKLVAQVAFDSYDDFAQKVPDPRYRNEFSWQRVERGFAAYGYKIVPADAKPNESAVQYLEVYRRIKGKTESHPAVRGFLAPGGSQVSVFLIDYDQEGLVGYGTPDEVWVSGFSVATVSDLLTNFSARQKLIDSIYERPEGINRNRPQRKRPAEKPVYTAIAKMGDVHLEVWQKGDWSVPFMYTKLPVTLAVAIGPGKTEEEKRLAKEHGVSKLLGFKRTFRGESGVVVMEYWKPKLEFSKQNVRGSSVQSSETIRIQRKGESEIGGDVAFFGTLHMVDYTVGGRWFRLVSEDDTGKFAKKKDIANPMEVESQPQPNEGP